MSKWKDAIDAILFRVGFMAEGSKALPNFQEMSEAELEDHHADVKINAALQKKRFEQANLEAGLNADGSERKPDSEAD